MNPLNMIKGMMGIGNPKDMAMKMLKNNTNPIFNNLMQMMEKGDDKGIEQFARNVFKEKNIDFDKQFGEFMNNFKK